MQALGAGLLGAQETDWLEMATGGHSGTEAVFVLAQDKVVATLPGGDAGTLSGMALVRAMAGDSLCELARCEGQGGAIAMSDAGTDGPFLAVYRDTKGAVWAACRLAEAAPMQRLSLGESDGDEIRLHCRGGVLYSYAADRDGRVEPLVAVALDLGDEPLLGILSLGNFSCGLPRREPLPATLAHTFDLDLGQPGTELSPSWTAREAPSSVNGRYLFHPPGEGDASAEVTVRDLHEGSYDLWVSDQPSEGAGGEMLVHVGGAAEETAFAVTQRDGGSVWLGLGRHRTAQGASLTIDFRRARGSVAPVSLDAVHLVWSAWPDGNNDGVPDALAEMGLTVMSESRTMAASSPSAEFGRSEGSNAPGKAASSQAGGSVGSNSKSGRIVLFVDASVGDDAYDGRAEALGPGPWHSSRTGPLRTIARALRLVGSAEVVELNLAGPLETPPGGLQTPTGAGLIVKSPSGEPVQMLPPTNPVPPKGLGDPSEQPFQP